MWAYGQQFVSIGKTGTITENMDRYSAMYNNNGGYNGGSNYTRHMLATIAQLPGRVDLRPSGNYSRMQLAEDFNQLTALTKDTLLEQVHAYDELWHELQEAKADVAIEQDHWARFVNNIHSGVSFFDNEDTAGMVAKSMLAIGVCALIGLLVCACCCAKSMRDACCNAVCPPVRVVHGRYKAPQEV